MNRSFANDLLFKNFQLTKKLFDEEECNKIINHCKKKTYSFATVVDRKKSSGNSVYSETMTNVRMGHLYFLHSHEADVKFAFDKIFDSAVEANFGWSLFNPKFLQITEYDNDSDGGFYKRHRDIIVEQNPQRIISCVVQLSKPEDYSGCRLMFDKNSGLPAPDEFISQGDAVFFLANEPHEVTPITAGVRYSLVAWLMGSPLWTKETLPFYF